MSYNEKLAQRVREALTVLPNVEEKKMFRGLVFLVNDKMCINITGDSLMCRIDPDKHDAALKRRGVETVLMGKRAYRGYVYVAEDAVRTSKQLQYWIQECLDFNPKAKSSKKK